MSDPTKEVKVLSLGTAPPLTPEEVTQTHRVIPSTATGGYYIDNETLAMLRGHPYTVGCPCTACSHSTVWP